MQELKLLFQIILKSINFFIGIKRQKEKKKKAYIRSSSSKTVLIKMLVANGTTLRARLLGWAIGQHCWPRPQIKRNLRSLTV